MKKGGAEIERHTEQPNPYQFGLVLRRLVGEASKKKEA
jgi:hypothetical protein